ncbi:MAG: zinc-binding alcohol dehydrogenase family protein [Melioribacteraceae bacterium]|nr:zinc-binding alcohol dehydrogenase family protein [Melioribacteraceae bacterium]MCF8263139.1 zinc-binding alcohol dehydrogenase family protein [Melioribacteraceae bacterium]MCF8413700.1 zinc-binding alcohol dehydrogenase family protein [Melioribacteraceae bacterium]MCF8430369.1 zinc-binding alcohol dehydrogenase family protein [Melioribacteraceae bacterium]
MKAAVTKQKGSPEQIQINELPIPSVKDGWVLIMVKAFGLNRSEMYTRQGHSPNVKFPIIQGIECVGIVENDPSHTFKKGQKVAAIMGEMGREFNGSYAEYVLVPLRIIFKFESNLPWQKLGAIPEMFQTVSGSLLGALEIQKGERLLIRGGTSSIGMLACQLAKFYGLTVISTTRNPDKKSHLIQNGSDYVLIDGGEIADSLRKIFPDGVHKVLELVGTVTLKDSLKCISAKGIVCMTGILGNSWTMENFSPMNDIPSQGRLTGYAGDAENLSSEMLQNFIDLVELHKIELNIDRVYKLEEIVEAHKYMESGLSKGKLVVTN